MRSKDGSRNKKTQLILYKTQLRIIFPLQMDANSVLRQTMFDRCLQEQKYQNSLKTMMSLSTNDSRNEPRYSTSRHPRNIGLIRFDVTMRLRPTILGEYHTHTTYFPRKHVCTHNRPTNTHCCTKTLPVIVYNKLAKLNRANRKRWRIDKNR